MKRIKKALPLLLIAALALSLCACDSPGSYTEYILDVDGEGSIDCGETNLTACEDPDIDGDGEPETPEEIVAAKKAQDTEEPIFDEMPIRRRSYAARIIDGVAYTGTSYYYYAGEPNALTRALWDNWARAYAAYAEENGEDADEVLEETQGLAESLSALFSRAEPFYGASAGREADRVTLRIPTSELPVPAEEQTETAPAAEDAASPAVEHAPSFKYLVVRMPGPAETNAGTAEGNVVTIDLNDPSQWEGLDEIVISAAVAEEPTRIEPLAVILPAVVLLLAAALAWLLIRRKKRAPAPPADRPALAPETPAPLAEEPFSAPIAPNAVIEETASAADEAPPAEGEAPPDGEE